MAKLSDLSLSELYNRPSITATAEKLIQAKEDFSSISAEYCTRVCKMRCKTPEKVRLNTEEVDIVILQETEALDGKYDRFKGTQEKVCQSIISFICQKANFTGLTYKLLTLLKCDIKDNLVKGKPPTAISMLKCKPYLLEEIRKSKPKVIVSLNTITTKALGFASCSNTGNRGQILDFEGIPVVVTLHPKALQMLRQNASGALWGPDYYSIILRDFEKASRLARNELVIPNLRDTIQLLVSSGRVSWCNTLDEVTQLMSTLWALPEQMIVSLDTETTSLDPLAENAKLLTIQFGWRDASSGEVIAKVIPLWHREQRGFNADEAWSQIVPWLIDPSRKKVLHNGKFDIIYIYHTTGVRVRGVTLDTLLLEHAVDSGIQGCYGLKQNVTDHLIEKGYSGYEDLLPKLSKKKKGGIVGTDTLEESEREVD